MGRAKTASGAPACFLSGISGWFSLSLGAWVPKNLARRSMEVWLRRRRRRFRFSDFRFEAAAATLSGTGSASPRPDRNSWLRGRVNPFPSPLHAREGADGQAVVCPLLRGRSPTRGVAPKQHRTRRLLTNRPCSSLVYEESDSKERLRVSNWIVQRLYNYAVKKTVEL